MYRWDMEEWYESVIFCSGPAGEGPLCLQDPPPRDGGTAEEVQRQEEAQGLVHARTHARTPNYYTRTHTHSK